MKNKIFIIGILLFLSFSLITAEDFGYNYLKGDLDIQSATNYSQVNVNNSQLWDGNAWDESRWVLTTGDTMTGDLTIDGALIIDGFKLQELDKNAAIDGSVFGLMQTNPPNAEVPHFYVQSGGSGQFSGMVRSWGIIDEQIDFLSSTNRTDCQAYFDVIGEELKIDCNTTTTGADFFVSDDSQFVDEVWMTDTDDEWHFMTRELELMDEARENSVNSQLNFSLIGNNLTIIESQGKSIVVTLHEHTEILEFSTDSILLTEGTNTTPLFNHVYYENGATTNLEKSTIQTADRGDVAMALLGDGFDYGSVGGSSNQYELARKLYFDSWYRGEVYQSGFDINVNSTQIDIGTGTMWLLMDSKTTTEEHSTSGLAIEIHSDGTFHQHPNDLNGFDEYSTGETISNNKYFSLVCGISNTLSMDGRLYCFVQDKPSSEHDKLVDAETDTQFVNYFPSNDFIKRLFVPVVQVVVKRSGSTNEIQTLSTYSGNYIDLRGRNLGTGGSPPVPGITSLSQLTIDTNFEGTGYNVTADNGFFNGWVGIGTTTPTDKFQVVLAEDGTESVKFNDMEFFEQTPGYTTMYSGMSNTGSFLLTGGIASGHTDLLMYGRSHATNPSGLNFGGGGAAVDVVPGQFNFIGAQASTVSTNDVRSTGGDMTFRAGSGSGGNTGARNGGGGDIFFDGGIPANSGVAGNLYLASNRGRVGIGTITPATKLHLYDGIFRIEDSGESYNFEVTDTGAFNDDLRLTARDGLGQWVFYDSGLFEVSSGGIRVVGTSNSYFINHNVGIGTTSPSVKLEVSGSLRVDGDINYTGSLNAESPHVQCSGSWCAVSIPEYQESLYIKKDANWIVEEVMFKEVSYTMAEFWQGACQTNENTRAMCLKINDKISYNQERVQCLNDDYLWDGTCQIEKTNCLNSEGGEWINETCSYEKYTCESTGNDWINNSCFTEEKDCKDLGYSYDTECFEIKDVSKTYEQAVESTPIYNSTTIECTQLDSELKPYITNCSEQTDEIIGYSYNFKEGCSWDLIKGYTCKERSEFII